MKSKRAKKFDLPEWGFEPRIFSIILASDLNFHGNPGILLKEIGLYNLHMYLYLGLYEIFNL